MTANIEITREEPMKWVSMWLKWPPIFKKIEEFGESHDGAESILGDSKETLEEFIARIETETRITVGVMANMLSNKADAAYCVAWAARQCQFRGTNGKKMFMNRCALLVVTWLTLTGAAPAENPGISRMSNGWTSAQRTNIDIGAPYRYTNVIQVVYARYAEYCAINPECFELRLEQLEPKAGTRTWIDHHELIVDPSEVHRLAAEVLRLRALEVELALHALELPALVVEMILDEDRGSSRVELTWATRYNIAVFVKHWMPK